MLASQERSERILRDLLRRMQIMKRDMERAAADHAAALVGVRTAQEFQALEEESQRTREELAAERSQRIAAQASLEKAEQAADTFLGETKKLQSTLSSRDEELKIVQARLSASEMSRVKAERERDSLLSEVQTLTEEREDAVRSKEEQEENWDLALEQARYEAAVRVRDATARENASRGTTFSFFNAMFPSPDDESPEDGPDPEVPTEAAQSTNRRFDGEDIGGPDAPHPEDDEEQIDFGSE